MKRLLSVILGMCTRVHARVLAYVVRVHAFVREASFLVGWLLRRRRRRQRGPRCRRQFAMVTGTQRTLMSASPSTFRYPR